MAATRARVSNGGVYTMRDVNQRTAEVFREINEVGEAALVTRRGRIIAAIVPLVDSSVESRLIGQIIDEVEHKAQFAGEEPTNETKSTEEVAKQLGLNVPDYPDREIEN